VPEKVKKIYRDKIKSLKDPLMVLELYFCGTLEHPDRIKEILKNGFSEGGKSLNTVYLPFGLYFYSQ